MSKYKAFLRITAMVLVALGVLAGLGFVERGGANMPVRDIAVQVNGASGVRFLDKDMLLKQVVSGTGPVIGTPVSQLDEAGIEHRLQAIPCIADVEVYHGLDGIVHVNATQREPVLRVINADGSGFYIDKNGFTMPLSSEFTARVPVFTGQLKEPYFNSAPINVTTLRDSSGTVSRSKAMYRLSQVLGKDPLWSSLFQQVVVDADGGFELIPSVGMVRVHIGNGELAKERLEKLREFYAQGIPQADWRRYSAIDLRFKDQVVCTKRTQP
ncbi:MAG: cell division protein FtsQ/DivIB [Flavobacteriales bacterium]